MIELLGFVGATLLALCSVPLLVKTLRDGHARGVSLWFMILWVVGGGMTGTYVALTAPSVPLLLNYALNEAIAVVVLWYRLWPTRKSLDELAAGLSSMPRLDDE